MNKMNKKGVEWHILLMTLIGIALLLVAIYIIWLLKTGQETMFTNLLKDIIGLV